MITNETASWSTENTQHTLRETRHSPVGVWLLRATPPPVTELFWLPWRTNRWCWSCAATMPLPSQRPRSLITNTCMKGGVLLNLHHSLAVFQIAHVLFSTFHCMQCAYNGDILLWPLTLLLVYPLHREPCESPSWYFFQHTAFDMLGIGTHQSLIRFTGLYGVMSIGTYPICYLHLLICFFFF